MAINYEEVGELVDSVVFINRVAKVVKGGRRFSFSALVVVVSAFTISRGRTMGYGKTCKSAVTVWVRCGYGVDTVWIR